MSSYRPTIQKRSSNGNRYIHPFYLFSGCIIILLLISFFYQFSELSNSKIDAIETFDSSKLRGQRSSTVNNNLPVLSIQSNNHINHNLQAYSHFLESTVLLIICSHRQDYLKRALEKVIMYHPKSGIPIFISEDGYHGSMQEVIDDASNHLKTTAPSVNLTHVHHPYYNQPEPNGYHKLSKHFKWAINSAFQFQSTVENVIILEEDLIIAPDFYSYFAATSTLLNSDPSILAVSAWNDNGQNQFVKDETQLYRSDFFPGLGWMVNKRIWEEELSPNWPDAYWDDWLREPERRKGRQFIRPEISRTFHIGVVGISNSQFATYLSDIKLNDINVDFSFLDLSYLYKDNWDSKYLSAVKSAPIVTMELFNSITSYTEVRIIYDYLDDELSPTSFVNIARWVGIMDNIKAGVPRTAYKGIVTCYKNNIKLHISPMNI